MALFSSRKNRKSNAAVVEAERRSESIEAGRLELEEAAAKYLARATK